MKQNHDRSSDLTGLFMIDPQVAFLNHGSFGACPRPVFERYQELQAELERQPVEFLSNRLFPLMDKARSRLAAYLDADRDQIVFLPNATFGVNVVARSIGLAAGDEVLTTDHEYGACDNIWEYISQRAGVVYKRRPVDLPVRSRTDFVNHFLAGVTERTKAVFLSHITSSTGLILPVSEICARAKKAGIKTIIDGAHAPGQVSVSLREIDPDFYVGNCHKWLMSPKGAGFLYAHPRVQDVLEPLVVGWGWDEQPDNALTDRFVNSHQWLGTNDPSAYLSVPAAIDFQEDNSWSDVREHCHRLLEKALRAVQARTGRPGIYADPSWYAQMASARLPNILDPIKFKQNLYNSHRVEIPITHWRDEIFLRISIQGYNSKKDVDRLLQALDDLLP